MSEHEPQPAQLRVVRGEPTTEELAVITAVVAAAAAAAEDEAALPAPRGRWNDPARMHRQPLLSGPGGWRAALR